MYSWMHRFASVSKCCTRSKPEIRVPRVKDQHHGELVFLPDVAIGKHIFALLILLLQTALEATRYVT